MKTLFTVFLLIFLDGSVGAVVDPDPNSLGVYFDLNADVTYLDVAPDTEFWAYVTLTNPTWDHVQAFEFGYELVVPTGMEGLIFRLADTLPPTSIFLDEMNTAVSGEYYVGMGLPYPTSEATILVHWLFLTFEPITIEFYLGPPSHPSIPGGLPAILNEDYVIMSVGVSSGNVNLPVAEVNTGHQPVAVKSAAWGGVKSLYR
ncbi:MAG: hypothetical protein ABFS42_10940 [Candidatus Krumholzibacteriota bacterium]